MSIGKERYVFIMDEKDVTTVMNVINSNNKHLRDLKLKVSNCGWGNGEESKWFISFYCRSKQYTKVLKGLLEIGTTTVSVRPGGQKDLMFERS